ncbi:MAG: fimbrial protein [Mixta sp.]
MRLRFLSAAALWLSGLSSANALDWKSDIIVSPNPLVYSAPADSVEPGQRIGTGWDATADVAQVFWCGYIFTCTKGTMEPGSDAVPTNLIVNVDGVDYRVFETGIQGVGFILGLKDFNAATYVPLMTTQTQTYPAAGTEGLAFDLGWSAKVTFIKTGKPLKTGLYQTPTINAAILTAYNNETKTAKVIINPVTLTVTATGCIINTKSVNVNLDDVNVRALPSVGSTSPAVSFNIDATCDANIALNAVITDQTNPGNTSTVASLTADSTASGIGIAFLYNGTGPLALGPDSSGSGTLNQFFIQSVDSAQTLSLPFQARYVRTGELVPGSANALASITFSYQ